jgi:hypothetical protein
MNEPLTKLDKTVTPAKAGVEKQLKILDSGPRFSPGQASPE